MNEINMNLDEDNRKQMIDLWLEQPFYVLEKDSYNRILNELEGGVKSVPSYILHNCTHVEECGCPKMANTLNSDGKMVREVNGVEKAVYSSEEVNNWGG